VAFFVLVSRITACNLHPNTGGVKEIFELILYHTMTIVRHVYVRHISCVTDIPQVLVNE
jgi:hypothetical protein